MHSQLETVHHGPLPKVSGPACIAVCHPSQKSIQCVTNRWACLTWLAGYFHWARAHAVSHRLLPNKEVAMHCFKPARQTGSNWNKHSATVAVLRKKTSWSVYYLHKMGGRRWANDKNKQKVGGHCPATLGSVKKGHLIRGIRGTARRGG